MTTNITINQVKTLIHLEEKEALSSLFNNIEEEFIKEERGHMEYQRIEIEGGWVSRSRHWERGERVCGRSGEWKYGTTTLGKGGKKMWE